MKAQVNYRAENDEITVGFFGVDVEETDQIKIEPTTTDDGRYVITVSNKRGNTQAVVYLYKAQMEKIIVEFFN